MLFHNAHASTQLPSVALTDNTIASTPNVGSAAISSLLLPTSRPSMKSSSHISHVVKRPFNALITPTFEEFSKISKEALPYCSASYIENIYHSAIDHSLTFLRMSQKSKVAK